VEDVQDDHLCKLVDFLVHPWTLVYNESLKDGELYTHLGKELK